LREFLLGVVRFSAASHFRAKRMNPGPANSVSSGHGVLVVAVRCERHRSAGDARGTAGMTSTWLAAQEM
jgi:hypothetical protein